MRIYDIHPTHRTAIDSAGREAPLEPMRHEPRIPAGATSIEPPAVGEHEAARWTGEAWEVVSDWRGHVYWLADGSRHEITELGVEPPVDALDEAPPEPLADLADRKRQEVNAAYAQALEPLLETYPDVETKSWDAQRQEAEAYQAWVDNGSNGDAPPTPVLDRILQGRTEDGSSETLAELVGKVLANAQAFIDSQLLTGRRHRLEKRINTILADEQLTDDEKRAALEAIKWPEQ